MHFNHRHIENMVSASTLKRGKAYYLQGRVNLVSVMQDTIVAEVQGSGRHIYTTYLYMEHGDLYADCSCPVTHDCKHGVATAFAWLADGASTTRAPSPLDAWFDKLQEQHSADPAAPQPARHHLLYTLRWGAGHTDLDVHKAYLRKDGQWSQMQRYNADAGYLGYFRPDFMHAEDETLLELLRPFRHSYGYRLQNDVGGRALQKALHTGRLHVEHFPQALVRGPQRRALWHWGELKDGMQLQCQPEGLEEWHIINTEPPHYVDPARGEVGLLDGPLPSRLLCLLQDMPPVPREQMTRVALQLRQHFDREQLPLPEEPEVTDVDTPVPQLTLVAADSRDGIRVPGLLLDFHYGPVRVSPDYVKQDATDTLHEIDGHSWRVQRDWEQETAFCDRVADLGLALDPGIGSWSHVWLPDVAAHVGEILPFWRRLEANRFPELQAAGWHIDTDPSYSLPTEPVQVDTILRDGERHWFDFELKLSAGNRQLSTDAVVGAWLEMGAPEEFMLPHESGWLEIDTRSLRALRDLIESLFGEHSLNGPLPLPAFRAAQLPGPDILEDRGAPLTRKLAQQLREFQGLQPVPASPQLQATLRPYQQQGLDWLYFLFSHGFGGILADDMGLGKTVQTLALVQHLKDCGELTGPALILAPTSVAGNWLREIEGFCPGLRSLLIHGPTRHGSFARIAGVDIVITTYPLLLRDHEQYAEHAFSLLVLDEAQVVKNPGTKLARRVRSIRAGCRLCLTGTPLENHLGELWALMDVALPGLLGGQQAFRQQFRLPIEERGDRERQLQLATRVAPFLLRRTKAEVATELQPKTELVQYVELAGQQRALYESIRMSMQKRIRQLVARQGMARSHIQFLDALLKLRQACIDPRLVKLDKAADIRESAKLAWLRENLPQLVEEGRRLLVFSQFTQVLSLVEEELKPLHIAYSKLTGQTRKRQEAIDRFQNGDVPVFLISLKAGGSGLNLTAADVVIHLDPWWNPAVEAQASDRAYRIGQDKPVFVYKLIAADTVEERIQTLQAQKRALADTLFSDTGAAGLPQDGESLLALLEP
ncbi:DEAD/DEAH box helicase [Chromatocurvus halotolerans]|uniref:SNF2 family DNA or RNA helicase n=1 Tax=Chromatocurvus halotolerans TaxID=1132028 RepID=A0A4R2KE27_9GAMM|nr:DEAD/DEAH box helicase [Chromatocurvus halotolerans]TCO71861.1 SNF2 family DNA or RNA helicase [Chromatocurvus halotolerans]